MKIVYISSSTIPSRAANSIHVMKMCQAFARHGNSVTLLAPDKKHDYEDNVGDPYGFYGVEACFDIDRLSLPDIRGRGYLYGLTAGRRAHAMTADLVYCRNIPGCFFSMLFGLKVILEIHAPPEDDGLLHAAMFRTVLRSSRLVKLVAITDSLRTQIVTRNPTLARTVVVAPDGADAVANDAASADLGAESSFNIGYVGHLFAGRGVELIVELARRTTWANFHLVGGTDSDIAYWRAKTKTFRNIHFHGFVSPAIAERYRLSFDVLLAPYQAEVAVWGGGGNTARWMSPLKLFEYMAAGKAIVSSDLPALREILNHQVNALLCAPDDIEAWATALLRLRDNEELRVRLGYVAREEFLTRYTWEKRAERLLAQRPEDSDNDCACSRS